MDLVTPLLWLSTVLTAYLWLARGDRAAGVYALMVGTYLIVGAL